MMYGFYDETMERLRRVYPDKCATDKDAVILLAQEIDQYREKIQRLQRELDGLCTNTDYQTVWKNCQMLDEELRICRSDCQTLKEIIVKLAMKLVGC